MNAHGSRLMFSFGFVQICVMFCDDDDNNKAAVINNWVV